MCNVATLTATITCPQKVKAVNEGDRAASRRKGSAVPLVNSEKWSHGRL
ncbi:hypothetical protein VB740_31290 [Nostoc sp. UHCC 0251]|nr:hypothetical protein [Nostoc sp. UHCC 0251]